MLSQVTDSKFIVPYYKAVEKLWNVYFWVNDAEANLKDIQTVFAAPEASSNRVQMQKNDGKQFATSFSTYQLK